MTTLSEEATQAMADLGDASARFLDRAIVSSNAAVCGDCSVEQARTPKGLTITRLGILVTAEAHLTNRLMTGCGVSFKVTWSGVAAELPNVEMNIHDGEEVIPKKITVKDFPWIATVLSDLIDTPHLRLVK
ncbi:hypothetical protein HY441_02050 [Candidatus Microgenomates bacterium]|nr:hypothetical protein [Candidatus Microgenomates bacterium]